MHEVETKHPEVPDCQPVVLERGACTNESETQERHEAYIMVHSSFKPDVDEVPTKTAMSAW